MGPSNLTPILPPPPPHPPVLKRQILFTSYKNLNKFVSQQNYLVNFEMTTVIILNNNASSEFLGAIFRDCREIKLITLKILNFFSTFNLMCNVTILAIKLFNYHMRFFKFIFWYGGGRRYK